MKLQTFKADSTISKAVATINGEAEADTWGGGRYRVIISNGVVTINEPRYKSNGDTLGAHQIKELRAVL